MTDQIAEELQDRQTMQATVAVWEPEYSGLCGDPFEEEDNRVAQEAFRIYMLRLKAAAESWIETAFFSRNR